MDGTSTVTDINATDDQVDSNITVNDQFDDILVSDPQYQLSKALGKYILIVIYIIGTLGNGLSFVVMIRRSMRVSSTALYMAALAIADSMALLTGCLRRWVFEMTNTELLNVSAPACYIVNAFTYFSSDMAAWLLVAMTIDRVIVVTRPLKAHVYTSKSRTAIALLILTVLIAALNAHFFFTATYELGVCTAKEKYKYFYYQIWNWIDSSIFSFIPFLLLLIFNTVIIISMTEANKRKKRMLSTFVRKRSEERLNTIRSSKLTIMLLSVTFAFIMLTAPLAIVEILRHGGKPYFDWGNPASVAKYTLTKQLARILAYINHSINFFLYCVTGSKFRKELATLFSCRKRNQRQYTRRSTRISFVSDTVVSSEVKSLEGSQLVKGYQTLQDRTQQVHGNVQAQDRDLSSL